MVKLTPNNLKSVYPGGCNYVQGIVYFNLNLCKGGGRFVRNLDNRISEHYV